MVVYLWTKPLGSKKYHVFKQQSRPTDESYERPWRSLCIDWWLAGNVEHHNNPLPKETCKTCLKRLDKKYSGAN